MSPAWSGLKTFRSQSETPPKSSPAWRGTCRASLSFRDATPPTCCSTRRVTNPRRRACSKSTARPSTSSWKQRSPETPPGQTICKPEELISPKAARSESIARRIEEHRGQGRVEVDKVRRADPGIRHRVDKDVRFARGHHSPARHWSPGPGPIPIADGLVDVAHAEHSFVGNSLCGIDAEDPNAAHELVPVLRAHRRRVPVEERNGQELLFWEPGERLVIILSLRIGGTGADELVEAANRVARVADVKQGELH